MNDADDRPRGGAIAAFGGPRAVGEDWRRIWPDEWTYWAIIDPKSFGRVRLSDAELANLLESWIPLPLEDVHAAFVRLADGRAVVCALERSQLDRADLVGCLSLVPEALPEALPPDVRDALSRDSFELLHGRYAPREVSVARRRFAWAVAAIVGLVAALGAVGLARRGDSLRRAVEAVESRRLALVDAAFAGRPGPPGVPAELRLVAELRELRGTRSAGIPVPFDAAEALAALLLAWPDGVDLIPESIMISERSLSVRGAARGAIETQRLADAVGSIPGWRLEPPQFRAAREGVSFAISSVPLSPANDAGGGLR